MKLRFRGTSDVESKPTPPLISIQPPLTFVLVLSAWLKIPHRYVGLRIEFWVRVNFYTALMRLVLIIIGTSNPVFPFDFLLNTETMYVGLNILHRHLTLKKTHTGFEL